MEQMKGPETVVMSALCHTKISHRNESMERTSALKNNNDNGRRDVCCTIMSSRCVIPWRYGCSRILGSTQWLGRQDNVHIGTLSGPEPEGTTSITGMLILPNHMAITTSTGTSSSSETKCIVNNTETPNAPRIAPSIISTRIDLWPTNVLITINHRTTTVTQYCHLRHPQGCILSLEMCQGEL